MQTDGNDLLTYLFPLTTTEQGKSIDITKHVLTCKDDHESSTLCNYTWSYFFSFGVVCFIIIKKLVRKFNLSGPANFATIFLALAILSYNVIVIGTIRDAAEKNKITINQDITKFYTHMFILFFYDVLYCKRIY